jgi:hypothetical protein
MTFLSIRRVSERCLWSALLFATVYLSYRYPLQYNFSGTSPTYSDTPVAFQLAKFLVILLICLVAAPYIPRRVLPYKKWVFAILVVCMSAYPLTKAIGAAGSDAVLYLETAFWPLAALMFVLATTPTAISALDRFFRFIFFYALVSNAIEVFLFLTIGRLPALAYENSFSVRFGGFLDDPNGFAGLLYLLMGWAYCRFSGKRRFFAQALLILCVFLTQSLTALAFLVLLTLWFLLIHKPRPLLILSLSAILVAIVTAAWSPLMEMYSTLSEQKSGSVDQHIAQVTATSTSSSLDWLLGKAVYAPYESWWTSSVVNYGIPWGLLCLSIVVVLTLSTYSAFRSARSVHHKAVMSGILLFSCYFLVGNINLPFFMGFPINFLFFVFAFLVFFDRIKEHSPSVVEGAPRWEASLALDAPMEGLRHRPALD